MKEKNIEAKYHHEGHEEHEGKKKKKRGGLIKTFRNFLFAARTLRHKENKGCLEAQDYITERVMFRITLMFYKMFLFASCSSCSSW